jgi:uncharacterized membrane protein YczE
MLIIEAGALIIGWMLGGFVGIGTLITALGIGYCVQIIYKLSNLDIKLLKHRNIKEGFRFIRECIIAAH